MKKPVKDIASKSPATISSESTSGETLQSNKGLCATASTEHSRRNLLKGLLLGGVAVSTGIIAAKKVYKHMPSTGLKQSYLSDVAPGDRVHQGREHVVMTAREKADMVKFFKSNYKRNS
ncbi:MAG: hypothetical protein KAS88_01415 [Deltaproteobacteria bacterium]|nr:hypothetical protein [Deltaproteobacteria bacterium]